MKATFSSHMKSFYTCSYTSPTHFSHLGQILKIFCKWFETCQQVDLPDDRIYHLSDDRIYHLADDRIYHLPNDRIYHLADDRIYIPAGR